MNHFRLSSPSLEAASYMPARTRLPFSAPLTHHFPPLWTRKRSALAIWVSLLVPRQSMAALIVTFSLLQMAIFAGFLSDTVRRRETEGPRADNCGVCGRSRSRLPPTPPPPPARPASAGSRAPLSAVMTTRPLTLRSLSSEPLRRASPDGRRGCASFPSSTTLSPCS